MKTEFIIIVDCGSTRNIYRNLSFRIIQISEGQLLYFFVGKYEPLYSLTLFSNNVLQDFR